MFPQDVAGLVWLDALHRDWDDFMPPTACYGSFERAAPSLARLEEMGPALREMRVGLLADYPEDVRQALVDAKASASWVRVGAAERTGLTDLAAELRAGPGIPDVPVVALTVLEPGQEEMHDGKTRLDSALVKTVSWGRQRILTDTAHHRLCFDRADAVVQAIRDVVDRTAHGHPMSGAVVKD
ncbi:hypothetical protein GCM10029964_050050 [Kibdelosporangium lantanae]